MTEEYDRMQPKMMTLFRFGLDIFISLIIEYNIRIRLHLVKHLMIKVSEICLTQRFDDSMSSFSSEKDAMRIGE